MFRYDGHSGGVSSNAKKLADAITRTQIAKPRNVLLFIYSVLHKNIKIDVKMYLL